MKKAIFLFVLLSILSSCNAIKQVLESILGTGPGQNTEILLNDAIAKISQQSDSWQATLQELTDKLTKDAQSIVKNEVQNLANNTIAAAGSEFRCDADFLGNRVKEGLERIKAKFLNQPIPERVPATCQIVPFSVDMNLAPARRTLVDISGYNFDNQPNLKLYLVSGSQKTDVTSSLTRSTDYHMVVNLGSTGINLNSNSNAIVLEYNNRQLSTIPIIQPVIPDCIVEEKTVTTANSYVTFVPPHTRGDREFYGHGPLVYARASIAIVGNTIEATVYMWAYETNNGDTRAEGTTTFTLYTAPADRKILQIVSDNSTDQSYTDTTWEPDVFQQGGGELVSRFWFIGDVSGEEAGTKTKVDVYFNPIRVVLKEVGNCKN